MLRKNKLVVGLGNTGPQYQKTRHNFGFVCLDGYALKHALIWQEKPRFEGIITEMKTDDTRIVFLKPTTFMNNSGRAVAAVKDFYKVDNDQILVIHDELDLPFGTLRTRMGGSAAGNNGIKSVSAAIGEDYLRIRCGISNEQASSMPSEAFVLAKFTADESSQIETLSGHVGSLIDQFIRGTLLPDTTRLG